MKSTLIIFILIFSPLLLAENPKEIIVATKSWKGATNRDGTGLYWDIIKEVYEPLGYTIIKKYKSYDEAAEMVRTNNADIYLAAYTNQKGFALYPRHYFDQDVVVAIFRKDAVEKWEGRKSLEGLKVGWVRGYDYDKYLNVKVDREELSNRNNGMKQLTNERLDAFVDTREHIKPYFQKAKLDPEDFGKKIILQLKLFPAFAKTVKGQTLIAIWDKRMKELIKTEEFKNLYYESEYTIFPY